MIFQIKCKFKKVKKNREISVKTIFPESETEYNIVEIICSI